MLIIAGHVPVAPEVKADLQRELEIFVAATRAEPGCRAFWFGYDAVQPELMRVFEIFDDANAFEAHRNSPHMERWRTAREKLGVIDRVLSSYEISSFEKI